MGKTKSNNKRRRNNNRSNKVYKYKKEKRDEAFQKANEEGVKTNPGTISEESQNTQEGTVESVGDESRKRELTGDDSDTEETPKRKKKKKQPIPATDGADSKKGKKSIRQMKREKHLERQLEEQSASKEHIKTECLSYISQWKHDKQNWKFMKAKQVWLNKNKFSSSLVPDESWSVLLEYFDSARGNIRNMLLADATNVIKQMDEWTEKQSKESEAKEVLEDEEETGSAKPDETAYKRARDLIQCLSE